LIGDWPWASSLLINIKGTITNTSTKFVFSFSMARAFNNDYLPFMGEYPETKKVIFRDDFLLKKSKRILAGTICLSIDEA